MAHRILSLAPLPIHDCLLLSVIRIWTRRLCDFSDYSDSMLWLIVGDRDWSSEAQSLGYSVPSFSFYVYQSLLIVFVFIVVIVFIVVFLLPIQVFWRLVFRGWHVWNIVLIHPIEVISVWVGDAISLGSVKRTLKAHVASILVILGDCDWTTAEIILIHS